MTKNHKGDHLSDSHRSEHRPDTAHVLHQITPEDRRAANQRESAERQRDASHSALPGLEIYGHGMKKEQPVDHDLQNGTGAHPSGGGEGGAHQRAEHHAQRHHRRHHQSHHRHHDTQSHTGSGGNHSEGTHGSPEQRQHGNHGEGTHSSPEQPHGNHGEGDDMDPDQPGLHGLNHIRFSRTPENDNSDNVPARREGGQPNPPLDADGDNNNDLGDGLAPKTAVDHIEQAEFQRRAEGIFNRVDTHGTGRMNFQDLGNALESGQYHGADAQILAALYSRRHEIANLAHDELFGESGISHQDLARLNDLTTSSHRDQHQQDILDEMNFVVDRTFSAQALSSMTRNALFQGHDAINPNAINQGRIGDCYFEASVASVAQSNPESIRRMIADNGNGTYTVTFPGDPSHPITVNAPSDAEMGVYQGGSYGGAWPAVLERAYGEYRQRSNWLRQGNTSADGADGGGRTADTTRLLTGEATREDIQFLTSLEETRARLTDAMQSGQAVTASTGFPVFVPHTTGRFAPDHAYSIIGFDPDGPGGGTVAVHNPWGVGGADRQGTYYVSLEEFRRNFYDITYQHNQAVG